MKNLSILEKSLKTFDVFYRWFSRFLTLPRTYIGVGRHHWRTGGKSPVSLASSRQLICVCVCVYMAANLK